MPGKVLSPCFVAKDNPAIFTTPPLIAHPFKSLIDKWNTASKTLLPTLGAAWAHQVQPPNLVVGLPKWQCTLANLVNLIFDWWIFLGCWHAVVSWLVGISFWIQPKHVCPPCMQLVHGGVWHVKGSFQAALQLVGFQGACNPPFELSTQPHMGLVLAGAPHACLFCPHMVTLVSACHAISNIRFDPTLDWPDLEMPLGI